MKKRKTQAEKIAALEKEVAELKRRLQMVELDKKYQPTPEPIPKPWRPYDGPFYPERPWQPFWYGGSGHFYNYNHAGEICHG